MIVRWILCALALAAAPALAQNPMPLPTQYPNGGQYPGDTNYSSHGRRMQPSRNPADSARADSLKAPRILVEWPDPDSTMAQLLQRTGYTTTRYQSKNAQLNSINHELKLSGKAAVERVQTTLVADTIIYNDSLRVMRATAPMTDTIYLRDPSQGTADLLAHRAPRIRSATPLRTREPAQHVVRAERADVVHLRPRRGREGRHDGKGTQHLVRRRCLDHELRPARAALPLPSRRK